MLTPAEGVEGAGGPLCYPPAMTRRRTFRGLPAVLCVLPGLVLLSCGGTAAPTATRVATPSTSAAPSPTAAPPSATASGPSAALCGAGFLTASEGASNSGPGSRWLAYVLTNTGDQPCTMSGYPVVTLADAGGIFTTTETDQDFLPDPMTAGIVGVPNSPVVVTAGGSASFDVQYGDTPNAGETCRQATELQIILPGIAGAINSPSSIAACGGAVFVSPVHSGTALPS